MTTQLAISILALVVATGSFVVAALALHQTRARDRRDQEQKQRHSEDVEAARAMQAAGRDFRTSLASLQALIQSLSSKTISGDHKHLAENALRYMCRGLGMAYVPSILEIVQPSMLQKFRQASDFIVRMRDTLPACDPIEATELRESASRTISDDLAEILSVLAVVPIARMNPETLGALTSFGKPLSVIPNATAMIAQEIKRIVG